MGSPTLKPGWTRVRFGDVVRLSTERSTNPEAAGLERYVGLEHMDPGDIRIRRWGDVAGGTTFTSVFRSGQVLFGKRRAYQRKVAVPDFSGVCSGDIYVFASKDRRRLLPDLLPFLCRTHAFFDHAISTSAGSLSPRTNWKSLASFEFNLPPVDYQRHVVNLFDATNSLAAHLYEVSDALGTTHKAIYRRHFWNARDIAKTPIGHVAIIRNGTTPKRNRQEYWNGHIPWLPTAKVNDKYITRADEYITPKALKECSLRIIPSESTLVAMIGQGATRGRAALLQIDATINQNFAAVTPSANLHPRFLFYQLDALYRALRYWSQGSNQHALNCQLIADFPIWVPAMATQTRIAGELDRSFDAARASSTRATAISTVLEAMTESLLGDYRRERWSRRSSTNNSTPS